MMHYTVNFFKTINYGGITESDGIVKEMGYDEVFDTNSLLLAINEYKNRKLYAMNIPNLEVSLTAYEDEKCEIEAWDIDTLEEKN